MKLGVPSRVAVSTSARWVAAVAGLLLIALSGCGRSGDGASDGPPPEPTRVDIAGETANYHGTLDLRTTGGNDVTISITDFAYSPTIIEASRGSAVRIMLSNETAATTHTFTIPGVVDVEVAPGQQRSITVTAPAEAGYGFMCRFHADSGMRGALNDPQPAGADPAVEPSDAPPSPAPAAGSGYDRPGY